MNKLGQAFNGVLQYFKDKKDDDVLKIKKLTLFVFSFMAASSSVGEIICIYLKVSIKVVNIYIN